MSASSVSFLAFAFLFAALHALSANLYWRRMLVLVANVLFLLSFTHSATALVPLALFVAWGFLAVRTARVLHPTVHSVFVVCVTLLLFCYLKKYWFLSFAGVLPFPYLTLGLSYIFFRLMGLIVDARSEPALAAINPFDYFNFLLNFPTLIAGPIDRYQDFAQPAAALSVPAVGQALQRIAIGLFKVLVVSAALWSVQRSATAPLLDGSQPSEALRSAVVSFGTYPLYLYFNFSGYTDIVLGIGALFGKAYPENFNAPFRSKNFIEFWSRWHMSLSNWLRDYVYTPLLFRLLGTRHAPALDPWFGIAAYFVTFFLIGIWHGSTAVFAVYGLLLALGVSVNKLYQMTMIERLGRRTYRTLSGRPDYEAVARGVTYTWYAFCMICFWADKGQIESLWASLGAGLTLLSFVVLFAISTALLSIYEIGSQAWAAVVDKTDGAPWRAYGQAVLVSVLVFGCIAAAVLTQRIDADIVYQAF